MYSFMDDKDIIEMVQACSNDVYYYLHHDDEYNFLEIVFQDAWGIGEDGEVIIRDYQNKPAVDMLNIYLRIHNRLGEDTCPIFWIDDYLVVVTYRSERL